jgi:hypothetical protein
MCLFKVGNEKDEIPKREPRAQSRKAENAMADAGAGAQALSAVLA